ncbi:MAG: lysylphosphatidylglycerol synthase domain-containing protein [Candidatus Methanomethyliaceae archaeon]
MRTISAFIQTERGHKVEKLLGGALFAGSMLFLSAVLIRGWFQIEPHLRQMNIRLLAAGQLCTIAALLIGDMMWSLVQAAFDLGFSWYEGIIIHLVSGITKYIPGYAWQYMSKAYLSRKRGASSKRITIAMLTELILLLAGGGIIAALWGWLALRFWRPLPIALPSCGWFVIGAAALLVAIFWNSAVARWSTGDHRLIRQGMLWASLVLSVIGWMAFATAAWLISRAIYPISVEDFPQHVVALVASGLVSLLVFVVPSGLGVREMTLAFMLQGALPFTIGVLVSVLIRLSVVLGELLSIVIVLCLGLHRLRIPGRKSEESEGKMAE